ncbi:MAG: hypothetical protein AAF430_01925 [Myxococcota bacterium]
MTRRGRANRIAVAWALCATGLLALASGAQEATLADPPLAAPPEVAELHGEAPGDPVPADQAPTGDRAAAAVPAPAEPNWSSLLEDVWQAERSHLDERVRETRRASFELGAWNLDPAARVLIAGEVDGSDLDRAQAAVELAPHLPAAHMRLAKAIWLSGDSPMAAVRSLVSAVQAIAGHLEASFWFGGSALYFLAFALVMGGLLAIGLVGIAALPHASHDLGHFFSSHMPGFGCAAALASLLLLPLALGEGLLGLALAFAGIAVIYGKRAHRVALFLAVVGIGLGAYPVIRAAGAALAALPEDPVARAAFSVGQGLATPVDRARLEAAVESDPMAMRGLAVLARRAGNLGEADKLYQELLAAGANDVGALNNAANVRLELGHMESALEFYGRAAELGQSPVVLFNLAQAYGRAFQVEDLNRTIAEAQRVGGDLVARLTALQGTDTEGFVVDYPLTHDLFWSRAMRPGAGETVASEFRARFAPGALGRDWTLFAGVALVVILGGSLFGSRIHPARWCPRCGGRMCPRCNSSRGEMCSGCHRLFHQPEKTDRVLRLERVNALRNRERRMDRLSTLVSVVVPGAAGLLAEKPLRTWLGALFFTLAAAALIWREGIVPDPFVAGSAATLVFVGLAAIATLLYGLVVATSLASRRRA